MNKTRSIDTLQNKIRAIERVIVRHAATEHGLQPTSVWFGDMADMCTERKDLKKMLKKLLTAI